MEEKKAEITGSDPLISILSNSTWNKKFGLFHCFLIYNGSMHSLSFLLSSILGKQGMFSLIHWSYITWLPIVHDGERNDTRYDHCPQHWQKVKKYFMVLQQMIAPTWQRIKKTVILYTKKFYIDFIYRKLSQYKQGFSLL